MKSATRQFNCPSVWWALGWLLIAAVIIASLAHLPAPQLTLPQGFDKYEHIAAYGVLSGYFGQLLHGPRWHALVLGALFLLGALLELLQGMTAYRSMEGLDLLANSIGLMLGWLACRTPLSEIVHALDRRWASLSRR